MSAHTPGPWEVTFSSSGYPYQIRAINGDDKKPGAVGSCVTRWASISLPSSGEGLANARLMAAAPDLLSAAQESLALLRKGAAGWGASKDLLAAAIHKAIGAAQ